VQARLDILD